MFFWGVLCGPSFIITAPLASEAVCELFAARGAASMSICTLLDKKALLQQKQTRKGGKVVPPSEDSHVNGKSPLSTGDTSTQMAGIFWPVMLGSDSLAKTWKLVCYVPVLGFPILPLGP